MTYDEIIKEIKHTHAIKHHRQNRKGGNINEENWVCKECGYAFMIETYPYKAIRNHYMSKCRIFIYTFEEDWVNAEEFWEASAFEIPSCNDMIIRSVIE